MTRAVAAMWLVSRLAAAEEPPPQATWRSSLGGSLNVSFDDKASTMTGGLGATLFLGEPLRDDPRVPLGLLSFAQRPNTLDLSVSRTTNGAFTSMGTSFYPWDNAGLFASTGLEYEWQVPQAVFYGAAGVAYWPASAVRLLFSYQGYRTFRSRPAEATENLARCDVAVLAGPVLIEVTTSAGLANIGSAGAIEGGGGLTLTAFIGRLFSFSLGGTGFAEVFSTGALLNESGSASVRLYATSSVSVSVGWTVSARQSPSTFRTIPGISPLTGSPLVQTGSISLGARL